ncbi:group III truncated hemoglobin [Psychroflexus sp. MES1-P1E]|uniref:group III truncated hemoglobin n=1 Tax=Psychroflexus sp. MES1-P1E TaxID=2058320 RepID=UPI000C7A25C6|nr:group III truncated hemoglobin [Psychroflexus sp. MES1-P1E]PKG43831.1 globin [Psychroflexus sp. MES1-P1E]
MNTINDRKDVNILVNRFYAKIRKDGLLGPIFNAHISEEQWPEHLIKLTGFWETNLLGVSKFKGNPSSKHIKIDANLGHKIEQDHFGRWLKLWFETIDELYNGELAIRAKESARKMATGQFLTIMKNRPENKNPAGENV